ncbi:hypothetical protein [Pseudomonas marginalis]|uniref:hypothetical protein n=1 Tax=Pseudomonas marginalis TaxID=298 RepID=UPI0005FBAF26|nr:hypothetical protein [Pseudomonas marginalis]KJZ58060.1 hypothetical protein VC37_01625 [Pseudomonas marginalis]KJZ58924.1 hypothetical protein VC36_14035 [Pseudomonas marginalis]
MSINVSNFRQKFSKARLSNVAFDELLSARELLEPGQILISADNKFLHNRTHFIDTNTPRGVIDDSESLSDLNRYMLRMWLRKQ